MASSRWKFFIAAIFGLILMLLATLALLLWRQQGQPEPMTGPQVIITNPSSGDTAQAGSAVAVTVETSSSSSIERIELWVNGSRQKTLERDASEELGLTSTLFTLTFEEGQHMLAARAIAADGLVGQSLPVSLQVDGKQASQVRLAVQAEGGRSLAELAEEMGANPAAVAAANPGTPAIPAPGSAVIVPLPPAALEEEGERSANPGIGPAVPPSSGPVLKTEGPPLLAIGDLRADLARLSVRAVEPPLAPGNLAAEYADCRITLTWDDNAENEALNKVWLAPLGGPGRVIAQLEGSRTSGSAWYRFDAPPPGIYAIWIEASNQAGSQSSPMAGVAFREGSCSNPLATQIELEALALRLEGSYDRAYCYISLEARPEVRIPSSDQDFIAVSGGEGDIAAWAGGTRRMAVPIPSDHSLDLSGECWGWLGGALDKLGTFATAIPIDQWDGRVLTITGGSFEIGFTLSPVGSPESEGLVLYSNPALAPPYNLDEDDLNDPFDPHDPLERLLTWDWDGNPSDISGFMVFLNGNPVMQVGPESRGALVRLPGSCGAHIRWQVAAISASARGLLSPAYEYDQPPCEMLAEITFETIGFGESDDSIVIDFTPCNTFEAYYFIYLYSFGGYARQRQFWGGSFFKPMSCGVEYQFSEIAYPFYSGQERIWGDPHRYIIPINPSPDNPDEGGLTIETQFWDYDTLSADDLVADFRETLIMPYSAWDGFEKSYDHFFIRPDAYGGIKVSVRAFRQR